jgi:hypothetical protein
MAALQRPCLSSWSRAAWGPGQIALKSRRCHKIFDCSKFNLSESDSSRVESHPFRRVGILPSVDLKGTEDHCRGEWCEKASEYYRRTSTCARSMVSGLGHHPILRQSQTSLAAIPLLARDGEVQTHVSCPISLRNVTFEAQPCRTRISTMY